MGYHPRIETRDHATFVTTRTRNSELWFANNKPVETFTLGLLAKVAERRGAKLYAFALQGSHHHGVIDFPLMNRADFCRDLNSGIAQAVARLTPTYTGGRLWGRRYSGEAIDDENALEEQFFYTVLQSVQDGLVDKISKYPGYNCFHDAVCGIERTFKCVNWGAYNSAKRFNSKIQIKDYTETYTLRYERLPGYEELTQHEYRLMMERKLEERRQEIIKKRIAEGKTTFMGKAALLRVVPGTRAMNPKTSTMTTHRPRVLSTSDERRAELRKWYFDIYFQYKESSRRYLAGDLDVEFPPGTYRPPVWLTVRPSGPFSAL